MIQPGESIQIYFTESDAANQGFQYRVNYVRLSTSQIEYKPAGDYPNRPGSIAVVQFGQETYTAGSTTSFAADGQLDGPTNGWLFHHTISDTLSQPGILLEREFDSVDLSNGRIDPHCQTLSLIISLADLDLK